MVHNRRNSLAMAGLVDNENAENLQVNEIFLGFWKYGLGPGPRKCRTNSDHPSADQAMWGFPGAGSWIELTICLDNPPCSWYVRN